jgi:methylmalonyl-CoA mutase C-terminal domain/subunit
MEKKIRVLIGKPGLDGHDRGAKVVVAALRDAGFEVIYTGLHQTTDSIVEAAIQEDVDIIGLSILSGAHMAIFPRILDSLKQREVEHIIVLGGGIIPEEDISKLLKMGVKRIFTPGSPTEDIVEYIRSVATKSQSHEEKK